MYPLYHCVKHSDLTPLHIHQQIVRADTWPAAPPSSVELLYHCMPPYHFAGDWAKVLNLCLLVSSSDVKLFNLIDDIFLRPNQPIDQLFLNISVSIQFLSKCFISIFSSSDRYVHVFMLGSFL